MRLGTQPSSKTTITIEPRINSQKSSEVKGVDWIMQGIIPPAPSITWEGEREIAGESTRSDREDREREKKERKGRKRGRGRRTHALHQTAGRRCLIHGATPSCCTNSDAVHRGSLMAAADLRQHPPLFFFFDRCASSSSTCRWSPRIRCCSSPTTAAAADSLEPTT